MSRLRWAASTVAAGLALAATAVTAQAAPTSTAGAAVRQLSPEAAAQAATRAEDLRLQRLVRLPAGSAHDRGPQVAILRQPGQHAATSDLIDRAEFFTLPMTVKDADDYLTHAVPTGLHLVGSGSGSGSGEDYDIVFFGDTARSTRFTDPTLLYTFAPTPQGTALRVDAQTIVVHPHTPDEQVGPGAARLQHTFPGPRTAAGDS